MMINDRPARRTRAARRALGAILIGCASLAAVPDSDARSGSLTPAADGGSYGRIYVEVARFRSHADASRFGRRVAKQVPDLRRRLKVTDQAGGHFSVRAGPFGDRASARQVAEMFRRDFQLKPVVVAE